MCGRDYCNPTGQDEKIHREKGHSLSPKRTRGNRGFSSESGVRQMLVATPSEVVRENADLIQTKASITLKVGQMVCENCTALV